MKLVNIKIGEGSPIFCIYGDEGRGLHSQRDGAKAVSEAESILLLSYNVMRASAGRRAASSVKRRSHAARARRTNPKSGGVADGVDGRLSRLLQNGKDRRRKRDDKA